MKQSEIRARNDEVLTFVAALMRHLPDGELDDLDADDPTALAIGFDVHGHVVALDAPGRRYKAKGGLAFRIDHVDGRQHAVAFRDGEQIGEHTEAKGADADDDPEDDDEGDDE